MPRVLLVTSSYKPTAIADMHRARHLAWDLPACGWDVELLCPDHSYQVPEYDEPGAAWLFAPGVAVHEAPQAMSGLFRLASMRSIGWRALLPVFWRGLHLLRQRRFDVVYITTAHFPLFSLGPLWRQRVGTPYVLDFHDPWVRPDAGVRTTTAPVKRALSNAVAGGMERRAVTQASGVVAVSPTYLEELRSRYPDAAGLRADTSEAIPFAGSVHDFADLPGASRGPTAVRQVTYVGAGGSIMMNAFAAVCGAMQAVRQRRPDLFEGLRVHLHGTDSGWRPGGPRPLQEVAVRHGLGDIVEEHPARITYTKASALVASSDGLLVLGVDDAGYVPSKLFTYALTGAPLLASFRSDSPALRFFGSVPSLGSTITFGGTTPAADPAVVEQFLEDVRNRHRIDRGAALHPFLAPAMAARHAALFERVLAHQRGSGIEPV